MRHRLGVSADARWVVSQYNATGGNWLHIAQCLIGNDLVDTTYIRMGRSETIRLRDLLGHRR